MYSLRSGGSSTHALKGSGRLVTAGLYARSHSIMNKSANKFYVSQIHKNTFTIVFSTYCESEARTSSQERRLMLLDLVFLSLRGSPDLPCTRTRRTTASSQEEADSRTRTRISADNSRTTLATTRATTTTPGATRSRTSPDRRARASEAAEIEPSNRT